MSIRTSRCSTPFGIRGRNAFGVKPRATLLVCAQRLSASEEETRPQPRGPTHRGEVLNAFRHQRKKRFHRYIGPRPWWVRCSTPFGIRGRNATSRRPDRDRRIQVLNAFRHQRKKRMRWWHRLQRGRCAQRLSASEEETLPERVPAARVAEVLNAFRHQRKKRFISSTFQSPQPLCSTPFGIRGRNAPQPWRALA